MENKVKSDMQSKIFNITFFSPEKTLFKKRKRLKF